MKLPIIINLIVDTLFAILLINILPSTYPSEGKARHTPMVVGDRLKTLTAIYGPPIKKIPKIEKLNAKVIVGNQKSKDASNVG